ncbi:MAG: hypothetical protein CVV47_09185 [Spirochaetae bacterium HGW-Spirochaetae-3]|jgi:hypothetical protein|nr:MAG: hypothetical protein CVV47_09185 [Spirochaetae bacterium HGW-Spirochaetae-3]
MAKVSFGSIVEVVCAVDAAHHLDVLCRLAGIGSPPPAVVIKAPELAAGRRVSTLHSAKGLDFPVVLLFLDRAPFFGTGYDDESIERMSANLVYVAMTKAMDRLDVFTLENQESVAIVNVARVFAELGAG